MSHNTASVTILLLLLSTLHIPSYLTLAQVSPEPAEPEPEVTDKHQVMAGPESEELAETEPEVEEEGAGGMNRDIYVSIYAIIITLIVAANVAVIVIVLKSRVLLKDPNNILLTSLVLARSFIGSFVVPAQITGMYSAKYLGSILCKLCHFVAAGSAAASVFSIVAVAFMKLWTLKRQEMFFSKDSVKTAWAVVGLVWLLGFIYGIRAPMVYDLMVRQVGPVSMWACLITTNYHYMSKYFIIVDLIVLFAIPLCIILYCYCRVIAALGAQRGTLGPSEADKTNIRNIQMIVTLVVLFVICTILPMFMSLYLLWDGPYFRGLQITEEVFYMFSYSNAWFNVFVFWHFRADLRPNCRKMFKCRRQHSVSATSGVPPLEGGMSSSMVTTRTRIMVIEVKSKEYKQHKYAKSEKQDSTDVNSNLENKTQITSHR